MASLKKFVKGAGAVFGGPYGALLSQFGGSGGGGAPSTTVAKKHPGGTAQYYDDSYGALLDTLKNGGKGGIGDAYTDILSKFQGSPEDLQKFLPTAAPFIASSIGNTDAFKRSQDVSFADPMLGYGSAVARIGASADNAARVGAQQLAANGLGRSAASATIARSATAGAGNAAADLYSGLRDRRFQMQMAANNNALDAHRMLATLALGQNPAPMQSSGGGSSPWLPVAAAAGGLAASLIPGIGPAVAAGTTASTALHTPGSR